MRLWDEILGSDDDVGKRQQIIPRRHVTHFTHTSSIHRTHVTFTSTAMTATSDGGTPPMSDTVRYTICAVPYLTNARHAEIDRPEDAVFR